MHPDYRPHHTRKDHHDPRDRAYVGALSSLPTEVRLESYLPHAAPVINQGQRPICSGVALASAANYLYRRRHPERSLHPVSSWMLYWMARRAEGITDPNVAGATARGALKGWHKNGVCGDALWPFDSAETDRELTPEIEVDARRRPLAGYFRIVDNEVAGVRSALAEAGVVYCTTAVHEGWRQVGADGRIALSPNLIGAHSFLLVGYDQDGFWLQNSFGESWGRGGYAWLSVEDWTANALDAWVVQLPPDES